MTNPPPCASMSDDVGCGVDPHDGARACPGRSAVRGCGPGDGVRAPAPVSPTANRGVVRDTRSAGSTPRSGLRQREMAACSAIELLLGRHARLDCECRDTGQPVLPVRRRKVVRGIHPLDRMAEHAAVDAERSESTRSSFERCVAPSPRRRTARCRCARPARNRPARRGRAHRPRRDHTNFCPETDPLPPIGGHPVHPVCRPVGRHTSPRCRDIVISSPETTGRRTEKPTHTRR